MKDLYLGVILVAEVVMAEPVVRVAEAMVVAAVAAAVAAAVTEGVLGIALVTFH